MACTNRVSYYITRGYSHKEVQVRCGTTDPYGGRALCDQCAENPSTLAEHQNILKNADADNAALQSAGWGEI